MQQLVGFFRKLVRDRIFQHIAFWCLSFLILVNILKVSAEIKQIDLIYTAIFHVPIFLIVYINLRLLVPLFLEKGRYFLYGILIVSLISIDSGFYIILFDSWIDYIFSGYYFIAYYGFWDISLYFSIYLFISTLFHLARGWFRLQETENEKTLAELKALKSQINPHFLFNSLNSIYSLARKKSDAAPKKIIQLSNLLRHIIYESESELIPLEKEIEMVRNYFELQDLRSTKQGLIDFKVTGDTANRKIAPLVFLPFIENSFKHGLKSGEKNAFINASIDVSGPVLNFKIENNKGNVAPDIDKKYGGIGIENVKKRLQLIYPAQHRLQITNNATIFRVHLQIQLK